MWGLGLYQIFAHGGISVGGLMTNSARPFADIRKTCVGEAHFTNVVLNSHLSIGSAKVFPKS
jgi:hypothetical protein